MTSVVKLDGDSCKKTQLWGFFQRPPRVAVEKTQQKAESVLPDGHVDIKDIDKMELLKRMWLSAPLSTGFAAALGRTVQWDEKLAKEDWDNAIRYRNGTLDYVIGRPIKVNITGDSVHAGMYDKYCSPVTLASVVEDIRYRRPAPATASRAPIVGVGMMKPRCDGCGMTDGARDLQFVGTKGTVMCASCRPTFAQYYS